MLVMIVLKFLLTLCNAAFASDNQLVISVQQTSNLVSEIYELYTAVYACLVQN